ncbi:MAG: alanine--tRNA ligase, partial [Phycisphaeraceae bacterium]
HNDLEDVGKDTYHHTFFEMLGNWSFGDYFKREAIAWAWELLTEVWGLDKSRLHATVFTGDPADGVERDEEAADLWRTVTDIDPEHIHYGDKKDNFWEMGETGPCGPCSEIHIDLTPDKSGAGLVNADDARVIEIWNLVFIQYNRSAGGTLSPLPSRHVDTGMGFERITAVLQGKTSNYDSDVFTPLFAAIAEVTGARPYGAKLDDAVDMAYRVIADHIRCLTFAITDGALPANEGRGYVLRRILRRAFRHGWQTLGRTEPFLHRLVPAVVDHMGEAFPELRKDPDRVAEVLREEEEGFARTIERGIDLFEQAAARGGDRIRGEDAFMLYDTYGFPLDLTQVMAQERGMAVDVKGFERRMEQARERSRAGAGGGDVKQSLVEIVQKGGMPATTFLGYNDVTEAEIEPTALKLLTHDDAERYTPAEHLIQGMDGAIALDQTPFYAEAGGQVGDTGMIQTAEGQTRFRVQDTIKVGDTTFHIGHMEAGKLDAGSAGKLKLTVDRDRREKIRANHTATHLLNLALRKHVGRNVDQRGSLVDDEKTRFDFSHNAAVNEQQLAEVEKTVNELIAEDLPVYADEAPQEEALKINGLRAVFGEKYPPRVRVVSVGQPVDEILAEPQSDEWQGRSIEFCGGTHLDRTGQAQAFTVISEEAVAKGVRRVTCLTGERAKEAQRTAERLERELQMLRAGDDDAAMQRDRSDASTVLQELNEATLPLTVRRRLGALVTEIQSRTRQQQKAESQAAERTIIDEARRIADSTEAGNGSAIVAKLEGADANALRSA